VLTPPPTRSYRQLDLHPWVGWASVNSTHAQAHA